MRESAAKQVLIVDSEEGARTLIKDALESAGYDVEVATDAADGIAAYRFIKPDAVVISAELPRTDGFAFLRMLRGDPSGKSVPTLVLCEDASRRGEAERHGTLGFLVKPIRPSEIVTRISAITGGPREPVRSEPRIPHVEEVNVRCEHWNHFVEMVTENVSNGGMFVATEHPPPVFTRVRVRLFTDDSKSREVVLSGEVCHVVSPERARSREVAAGIGVRFDELSPEQRREVDNLVKRASDPQLSAVSPAAAVRPTAVKPRAKPVPRLTPEEHAALAHFTEQLGRMKEQNYLERLELPIDADSEAVRRAFRRIAKRYHPDRHMGQSEVVREVVQEIYLLLAEAKKRLQDPTTVERLRRANDTKATRVRATRSRPVVVTSQKATLRGGVRATPSPNDAQTVARARRALSDGRYREAKELYSRLVAAGVSTPHNVLSLELARGHVCREEGDLAQARRHFEKACELDDQCVPAVRALRNLGGSRR